MICWLAPAWSHVAGALLFFRTLCQGARHFFARAKRRQGWLEAGIRTLED